jgi:hypothetical protein
MDKVDNILKDKYKDFLELIKCLSESYDTTRKEILALSISTAIRVLVHDTNHSTSLLSHLNKKNVEFLSTSCPNKQEAVYLGIVRRINLGVKDGVGGEAKYWPLCNEEYFPMPKNKKYLPFEIWWDKEVIFKSKKSTLTRKDLILSVANKDGGAHFDNKVQKKYDDFRHSWSGGSTLIGISSGEKRGYDNIPTYPAIRQIAYELLKTLN